MKIHFTLFFLILSFLCFGQTILNKENGNPVADAEVSTGNRSSVTDENGHFYLEFEKGKTILIRVPGYPEVRASISDFKNGIYYYDFAAVELETVVISPSRWKGSKINTGHKTDVYSKSTVEINNPMTMADLLGTNNDIFIQKSQLGGGSPMIRGFAANRLLITVDGVRMNSAVFRSGNVQSVISLDANSIERAEVMLGPGSLLYGSDAIGGVMNFYMISPKFSKSDKIEVNGSGMIRYASAANENTVHFDFNIGGKKFASATAFSHNNFSDMKMGKHGPDEYLTPHYPIRQGDEDIMADNPDPRKQLFTGYDQYNFTQKFRYKPNDNWDLNYGLHYSTTSNVPRYDRYIIYKNDLLKTAEWYYGPQRWMMNSLSIENSAENKFYTKAKLILAYQHFEESRHSRDFGKPNRTNQNEKVDVFSVNLDLYKNFNPQHTLFYGVEGLFNKVHSFGTAYNLVTGEVSPDVSRYPDGSTWDSYSIYASHEYKPSSKVTLQGGLRYSYVSGKSKFSNEFFDFPFDKADIKTGSLTGNLGVNFHPSQNTDLRAIFSTGFRAPNIDDIGKIFESGPEEVVVPNPDLKGEYAYSGEIGAAQKIGEFAMLDVSVYYINLKNAMVKRNFQLNGQDSVIYNGEPSQVLAIQNAAKAYSYGIEAKLDFYLSGRWSLKNAVNYQKGKEELDNGDKAPLRHVAPLMIRSGLNYKAEKFRAEFYFLYNGEFDFDDLGPSEQSKDYMYAIGKNGKPYLPSWYTINLKGVYDISENLAVSAGWENITNQRYRPYSSGLVAPGSNLIFSVRYNF